MVTAARSNQARRLHPWRYRLRWRGGWRRRESWRAWGRRWPRRAGRRGFLSTGPVCGVSDRLLPVLQDQYRGSVTRPIRPVFRKDAGARFQRVRHEERVPAVKPRPTALPTPAQLAERAAASFELPHPSGRRSPGEDKGIGGYPFTYVDLWTFYWTDPATWRPLTATASAGGNSATVTATPVSLTFDPGNGSGSVSCAGPGRPWLVADDNSPPSAGACAYRYSTVTGPGYDHPVTSAQTITWRLTWVGSIATHGTLTSKATVTNGPLNVLQIQTVNR